MMYVMEKGKIEEGHLGRGTVAILTRAVRAGLLKKSLRFLACVARRMMMLFNEMSKKNK